MRNTSRALLVLVLGGALAIGFNNCGGSAFQIVGNDGASDWSPGGLIDEEPGPVVSGGSSSDPTIASSKTGIRLLSGPQLLRSYSQVTGITPNNAILNEYNLQASSLADNPYLNSVTGPLWISTTAIASRFCDAAIAAESANGATRRLFTGVNFGGNINTFSGATYDTVIANLAEKFWGRAISEEEAQIMRDTRTAFTQAGGTQSVRNLALFVCTGMLSSMDNLTF